MPEIKAIETRYSGCRFHSRLEARWAVFFDSLGLVWDYEPEGYYCGEKYEAPSFDNSMLFLECVNCGEIKIEFSEGNYFVCDNCNSRASNETPRLLRAVQKARSARFEHGESG